MPLRRHRGRCHEMSEDLWVLSLLVSHYFHHGASAHQINFQRQLLGRLYLADNFPIVAVGIQHAYFPCLFYKIIVGQGHRKLTKSLSFPWIIGISTALPPVSKIFAFTFSLCILTALGRSSHFRPLNAISIFP